jgi:cell division protein FtsX
VCYRIAVVSTAPLMPGTYSYHSGTRTCSWQMRSQPEQTRRDVSTAVISACSALHDLAATEGMFGGCLLAFTHFSVIFFTVRSFYVGRRSYL